MFELWTTEELSIGAELLAFEREVRLQAVRMLQFYSTEDKQILLNRGNLMAILLKWYPGEKTEFHSHGSSIGSFYVVAGKMREERLVSGSVEASDFLNGEASAFEKGTIHRLSCLSRGPAITLHVYANVPGGLDTVTEYQTNPAGELLLTDGLPSVIRIRKSG